jgi:hypothetical protein
MRTTHRVAPVSASIACSTPAVVSTKMASPDNTARSTRCCAGSSSACENHARVKPLRSAATFDTNPEAASAIVGSVSRSAAVNRVDGRTEW